MDIGWLSTGNLPQQATKKQNGKRAVGVKWTTEKREKRNQKRPTLIKLSEWRESATLHRSAPSKAASCPTFPSIFMRYILILKSTTHPHIFFRRVVCIFSLLTCSSSKAVSFFLSLAGSPNYYNSTKLLKHIRRFLLFISREKSWAALTSSSVVVEFSKGKKDCVCLGQEKTGFFLLDNT